MLNAIPIDENPPHGEEVLLWLRAEPGDEKPIGWVVATYKYTDMGEMWVQKSVGDAINLGLRTALITHFCLLGGEPDERPLC